MAHWNNSSFKENGPQYIIENAYYSKRLVFERTMEVIHRGKKGGGDPNIKLECISIQLNFRLAMFR